MIEPEPITVNFMNELKDHLEAQRMFYKESFLSKADKVVAVLLFVVGAYSVSAVGLRWWTVIWFPLAVMEWFNLLTLDRLRTRIWFRRNPKFREEYCLTFSRESIHFKTAAIDSTLQWSHYERVMESSMLFLLMYGKGLYTLIPKRCFHSDDELNAFRVLLKEKIPRCHEHAIE
jgi:hypothetical protein